MVSITGTLEQVIQSAEKQNPNFRSDFGLDAPVKVDIGFKTHSVLEECGKGHRPCNHDNIQSVECVLDTPPADLEAFEEIIGMMSHLNGKPAYTLFAGSCAEIDCRDSSVVSLCNQEVSAPTETCSCFIRGMPPPPLHPRHEVEVDRNLLP